MTRRSYSSLAAFIAHWRALARTSAQLNPDENELLVAIDKLIDTLTPDERETLLVPLNHDSAEARRRERLELQLRRILLAAGWLQD
jgi:hypothetical protein